MGGWVQGRNLVVFVRPFRRVVAGLHVGYVVGVQAVCGRIVLIVFRRTPASICRRALGYNSI